MINIFTNFHQITTVRRGLGLEENLNTYLDDFITDLAFEDLALSVSADLDVPNNYSETIVGG